MVAAAVDSIGSAVHITAGDIAVAVVGSHHMPVGFHCRIAATAVGNITTTATATVGDYKLAVIVEHLSVQ